MGVEAVQVTLLLGHRFYVIPNATLALALAAAAIVLLSCGDSWVRPASRRSTGSTPRRRGGCWGGRSIWASRPAGSAASSGWLAASGDCSRAAALSARSRWPAQQRGGARSRAQPQLRGRGRPLRHQGHSRLRGGERRRLPEPRSSSARPHDQAAPPAQDGRLRALRRRGARPAQPTRSSRRGACAAAGWQRAATAGRARWCCSTSWARRASASAARRTRTLASGASYAARPVASAPARPSWPVSRVDRTITSRSGAGRAVDRPHRLRLRLLARNLRRHRCRLAAES